MDFSSNPFTIKTKDEIKDFDYIAVAFRDKHGRNVGDLKIDLEGVHGFIVQDCDLIPTENTYMDGALRPGIWSILVWEGIVSVNVGNDSVYTMIFNPECPGLPPRVTGVKIMDSIDGKTSAASAYHSGTDEIGEKLV